MNSGVFSVDSVGSVGSVGSVDSLEPGLLTTPMPPSKAPPGEDSPEDREQIKKRRAALRRAATLRSKNQNQNAGKTVLSTPMKQLSKKITRIQRRREDQENSGHNVSQTKVKEKRIKQQSTREQETLLELQTCGLPNPESKENAGCNNGGLLAEIERSRTLTLRTSQRKRTPPPVQKPNLLDQIKFGPKLQNTPGNNSPGGTPAKRTICLSGVNGSGLKAVLQRALVLKFKTPSRKNYWSSGEESDGNFSSPEIYDSSTCTT